VRAAPNATLDGSAASSRKRLDGQLKDDGWCASLKWGSLAGVVVCGQAEMNQTLFSVPNLQGAESRWRNAGAQRCQVERAVISVILAASRRVPVGRGMRRCGTGLAVKDQSIDHRYHDLVRESQRQAQGHQPAKERFMHHCPRYAPAAPLSPVLLFR